MFLSRQNEKIMIFTVYMEGYSTENLFASSVAELETAPEQPPVEQPVVPQQEPELEPEEHKEEIAFPKDDFQSAVREDKEEPKTEPKETNLLQSFISSDYLVIALLVLILAGLYYYFN